MTIVAISIVGAIATTVIALLLRWATWSVSTAASLTIEQTVNGKIDKLDAKVDQIGATVDGVEAWTKSHDRLHQHEQRQLIAALERQEIWPPDGWDRQ